MYQSLNSDFFFFYSTAGYLSTNLFLLLVLKKLHSVHCVIFNVEVVHTKKLNPLMNFLSLFWSSHPTLLGFSPEYFLNLALFL